MSNKKRIRKLIQAKYKPSRKVTYFDHHKFGFEFGKAAGNAAKQLKLAIKAFSQICSMMYDYNNKYRVPPWHRKHFKNSSPNSNVIKFSGIKLKQNR